MSFAIPYCLRDLLTLDVPLSAILGAIISDQYLGKYKTILIFAAVYWVGLIILWTTSLPVAIDNGAALGGYVTAIIVIAFGTGGIKSNIAPLIADRKSLLEVNLRRSSQ